MPPLNGADFIVNHANDSGMVTEWTEIKAWRDLCGVSLKPFAAMAIRYFSIAYQNAKIEYNSKDMPRPYYNKKNAKISPSIKPLRNR